MAWIGRKTGRAVVAAGVVGAVIAVASPVSAHVGVDKDEIEAGAATPLSFSFSHGCEESPTTSLRFEIPDAVNRAVPQAHPGWDVEIETEELAEPIEAGHGSTITERPAVISFTAREGFDVPSGVRDTVTVTVTAPEQEGLLHFKVIQGCAEGSNDWIEEWDGTGEEPESPAPSVMVVAASGDGADGHADEVGAEADAGDEDSSGGSSNGLAIAGIVLGAAGLGVGGTALVASRKRS